MIIILERIRSSGKEEKKKMLPMTNYMALQARVQNPSNFFRSGRILSPAQSKKARFSEQPFPLLELPRLIIDQIWDQLCEYDDMKEKFYLGII